MGCLGGLEQIAGAEPVGHDDHIPAAVGGGGAEGHRGAAQGLGQADWAPTKSGSAATSAFADHGAAIAAMIYSTPGRGSLLLTASLSARASGGGS